MNTESLFYMLRLLLIVILTFSCSGCQLLLELLPQKPPPSMDIKIALFAQPNDYEGTLQPVSYYPTAGIRDVKYVRKISLLHCGHIEKGEVIPLKDGTFALKLTLINTASLRWIADMQRAVGYQKLAFLVDGFLFATIDPPYHDAEARTLLIYGDWVDPELLEYVVEKIPENRKNYR